MNKNLRKGYFICIVCEEPHIRRSNPQKYCDNCKDIGHSRTAAKYYLKHSEQISKQRKIRNSENVLENRERSRKYYLEYVRK